MIYYRNNRIYIIILLVMDHKGYLSESDFYTAGRLTQFVSVDLLVYYENRLLLGMRKNNPAKNIYFVPGSKLYKEEFITEGLQRTAKNELGIELNTDKVVKLGLYEHIYDNNFRDDEYGVHYVVIPIEYKLSDEEYLTLTKSSVFYKQHDCILWIEPSELLQRNDVHKYVKYYFTQNPPNKFI